LCAPVLAEAGAQWLGVSSVDEGVSVRNALGGERKPAVLVMCGVWQGEAQAVIDYALTPVIWQQQQCDLLCAEAKARNLPPQSLPVHLEVDTGMARQGVALNELPALLACFTAQSPLRLDGVMTHLSSTEVLDSPQNAAQVRRFAQALETISRSGLRPRWVHLGNSSSIDGCTLTREAEMLAENFGARALVRPGLALYGHTLPLTRAAAPVAGLVSAGLEPVLAWKTAVLSLREIAAGCTIGYNATFVAEHPMRLALLAVGYADGLRRELSGSNEHTGGEVLIQERRAPIVGRISMDLTIVDVTAIPETALGDEAVILGRQGSEQITAADHARIAETIPYEILCGMGARVQRVLVD
jgi:alanine racemase